MKRSAPGVLLILLGLVLLAFAFLSAAWSRPAAAPTGPAAAESPALTPEPAPELTPEPTPDPTPDPTPEPTPSPRPLLAPQLTDYCIDMRFLKTADEQGTLLKDVAYSTRDYVGGREGAFDKHMQVYLPFGYDENARYDVLFLLHIRGADERFWLDWDHAYEVPREGTLPVNAVKILDNLIEQGLCRPMIVVSLFGYLDGEAAANHRSEQVYPQFAEEFAQDILPFVAEHYATWAEGVSREELSAARRHFGVLGSSFGAYQAELSILAPNLDLVSWFALTGGGSVTREYLSPIWQARGTLELPIDLLYFEEGEYDDIGPVEGSYRALGGWTEKFTQEENLRFTKVLAAGHEQREWVNALFNAAQLFFR